MPQSGREQQRDTGRAIGFILRLAWRTVKQYHFGPD
jgi:hypothetical protein